MACVGRGRRILHRFARDALDGVNARGAHRHADAAVLMKDIVDQIVVVADRRGRSHHEFACRPPDGRSDLPVALRKDLEMPPGGIADRALEDADRIRNFNRLAIVLRHADGDEAGIGRAVNPLPQRTQGISKTVFGAVHIDPKVPALVRVHVGDKHFGQMHLVGDGAPARTIARLDHGEHQSRPLVRTEVEAPHVPDETTVFDRDIVSARLGEARRFRLRTQRGAFRHLGPLIAPCFARHRHHARIGDVQHLAGLQVDRRKQALDRAGPVVRANWLADAWHLDQTAALLLTGSEIPGRERQAERLVGREAAFCQALDHPLIRKRKAGRAHDLFEQEGRLAGDRLPGGDAAGREVDGRFMHRSRLAHHRNGAARKCGARPPGNDRGFCRLFEIDSVEARLWPELSVRLEQLLDLVNLRGRQRVQRMRGPRILRRAGERRKKQQDGNNAPDPDRGIHARLL